MTQTNQLNFAGQAVAAAGEIVCHDVTARRAHQYAVVAVAALALLIGGPVGAILAALDGAIMALGRFWWPADIFRQAVWRVAEPRGWLQARPVPEDMTTRRLARVLGGLALFAVAAALAAGRLPVALLIAVPLCAMILFDATVNFCALCFLRYRARLLRYRLTRR